MNKKALLPALLVGLVISTIVINPSQLVDSWYLRWFWANCAGVFVGVILYRLAFQYFARAYYSAGGDRFAVLGIIMLLIPAGLQFAPVVRDYFIANFAQDINLRDSFLALSFKTPVAFLLANALPGLIFSLVYGVMMFVFRAEFNPPAAQQTLYSSLELDAEQVNRHSTVITVVYYVLLVGYVFYCGVSWYAVAGAVLLLFFRVSPVALSSVVLMLLTVYVELGNLQSKLPIALALIGRPDKFLHYNNIAPLNSAFVLIFVPFYVLEIAKRYSLTTTAERKPRTPKNNTTSQNNVNSSKGVYIGERIR